MTALVLAPPPAIEGEVVGNGFFLEANPFRVGSMRYVEGVPDGATLAEYAAAAQRVLPRGYADHIQIWAGEDHIDRRFWHRVRPKPGVPVYVRVRPQGKGGKNILRALIIIAIIAVAFYFLGPTAAIWGATFTLGEAIASAVIIAAITMVATLAVNALIPPPGLTGLQDNKDPRYSLQGSNNRYVPYGPIPRIFGKLKVFPVLAGRPFSENVGKKQYLRMLLTPGWGPLKISDIRIGNSPITAFKNVQVEIHEGGPSGWAGNKAITLYNRRVQEQGLSIELLQNAAAPLQTTSLNTVEIEVDIAFPYGLIEYKDDGGRKSRTVKHRIQYRAVGSGTWINAPLIDTDEIRVESGGVLVSIEKSPEAVRHSARWKVPSGQYEVQVIRLSIAGGNPAPSGDVEVDRSYWTTLRSFTTDVPVVQDGVCLIAIRMQATDQLNGVPDTISCVVESYLPVYSATAAIEGPELVTNGDGNAVAGWTELNAGRSSLTSVGGNLRITRPPSVADSQAWYQDITVVAGQTYRLRGKMYPNEGNKCRIVLVNGSTTNYDYPANAELNTTFVAAGTSVRIRLEAWDGLTWITADNYAEFDNISLKLQTTGAGWAFQITQNPAWAFADILRRRAGVSYLPDSRIDIPGIAAWAAACDAAPPTGTDAARWTFNGSLEGGSVFDALRQIASIGRASYTLKDGKHSVVRDVQQSTPVQHITPRNSWGYSGTRLFPDLPHALRVEFVNKDADYRVEERVVYADGYDASNATRFEVLQLLGCTSKELAFREARYHLAVGYLRPEEHRISMDVENLRCTLGDRVQLAHDVIAVGKAWGRIKSLITSGSNTVGFELDDAVDFENGKTYQLRVREADATTSIRTVTPSGKLLNMLQASRNLDQTTYWPQTRVTVGTNVTLGGIDYMALVKPTNAAGVHDIIGHTGIASAGTGSYSVSCVAKAAGYRYLSVGLTNTSGFYIIVNFDLVAGTVENLYNYGGKPAPSSYTMTALDGGLWRLAVNFTNVDLYTEDLIRACFIVGTAAGDPITGPGSAAGDTVSGIYIGQPQVAPGKTAFDGYYPSVIAAQAYSSQRNLCVYSDTFNNWYNYGFATVTTDAATAPDGTRSADRITPNTGSNPQGVTFGSIVTGSGTFCHSVHAKADGYNKIWLGAYDGAVYHLSALFDITPGAGKIVSMVGDGAGFEELDDGWFRVWAYGTTSGIMGTTSGFPIWVTDTEGASFTGDGTKGVFLWGAQVVEGTEPGLYIRNNSGNPAFGRVTDTVACSSEATAGGPAGGDIFMFGLTGIESLPAIVRKIEPGDDLSAVLTLVPYDDNIYTADTGAIPAFFSYLEGDFDRTAPAAPTLALRSDITAAAVTAAGTTLRLAVDVTPPSSSRIPITGFDIRYRLDGSTDWTSGPFLPAGQSTAYILPVQTGQVYEVAARTLGTNGLYSDWYQAADHTISGNTVAPQAPSGVIISIQPTGNLVQWTNPTSQDLRGVQLWANRVNSFTGAVKVGETLTGQMLHGPTYPLDTYYYWLVSVNNSGTSATPYYAGTVTTPPAADVGGGDNILDDPGSYSDPGGWEFRGSMNTRNLN